MSAQSTHSPPYHSRVTLVPIRQHNETLTMFYESKDMKKAFSVRLSCTVAYVLRMEMVYCFFDIPLCEAARIMRVSVTLIKRIRAWVHIYYWPCCLIHSRNFGLTVANIIKGRDDVISGLEKETGIYGVDLALEILREARDYAKLYACMVTPGTGRRSSDKAVERKRVAHVEAKLKAEAKLKDEAKAKEKTGAERQVKRIKFVVRVETTVVATVETTGTGTIETTETMEIMKTMETLETSIDDFWPREPDTFQGYEDVDDVLGLGPISAITLTTSVVIGKC